MLTWVCRRWANVVLGNAKFWSPLFIIDMAHLDSDDIFACLRDSPVQCDPAKGTRLIDRSLGVLQIYLSRSGSAPLNVHLDNA